MHCCFPCCHKSSSLGSDESIKLIPTDPLAKLFSDNQISTGTAVIKHPTKRDITIYGGKFEITPETINQFEEGYGYALDAAKADIKANLVTKWAQDEAFDHKCAKKEIEKILGKIGTNNVILVFRVLCLTVNPLYDFETNFGKLTPHF
jgi:hypothetical protein